jgi:hypothetical protein
MQVVFGFYIVHRSPIKLLDGGAWMQGDLSGEAFHPWVGPSKIINLRDSYLRKLILRVTPRRCDPSIN